MTLIEKSERVLAIVPARGGSKGIVGKNLKNCGGKPLINWTVNAIKGSTLITDAILTSDSTEIITHCHSIGLRAPFVRPQELAQDDTPMLPVIQHAIEWIENNDRYKPSIIVLLQPTSPLRTSVHIDEAIRIFVEHPQSESLVSITEVPHSCVPESIMEINNGYLVPFKDWDQNLNARQLKPKYYARNGAAIYVTRYDCVMNSKRILGNNILPYFMPIECSVDVDTEFDLNICDYLLHSRDYQE